MTPASECDLKWEKPDEEGLIAYMCGEKGFTEDRIKNGCKKLVKGRGGATQGRLDSFFKVSHTRRRTGESIILRDLFVRIISQYSSIFYNNTSCFLKGSRRCYPRWCPPNCDLCLIKIRSY